VGATVGAGVAESDGDASAASDGEAPGRAGDAAGISPNPSWPPDIGNAMATASRPRTAASGARFTVG
jgi:hypothetical protein